MLMPLLQFFICLFWGGISKALEDMKTALRAEPDNVKFILRAARSAVSLGNRTEGERYYARALELEPGNATAQKELKDLESIRTFVKNAAAAVEKKQFNNALSLLDRVCGNSRE